MTTDKPIECELVPETDKLVKYASQTGLEPTTTTSLVEAFKPIFAKAQTALVAARGVAESVKDATCVREIKQSRACRLEIRKIRLESDETRKRQKQHALIYGRAVDGFHNILMADLSPVEAALQEAEDVAERAEAARMAALKDAREKELAPYLDMSGLGGDLSLLDEGAYSKMLADAKLLHQAKIDAAAKAEAEAKAKAESDKAERERIAAENARLKAEADAREAQAKKEREEAARLLAQERAAAEAEAKKARKEREALEAKAKAEKDAAEAAARAFEEKARKERQEAAEKARKEREELEAKAQAERKAAAKAARLAAEQAARERAAAEVEAKKERDRLKAIADAAEAREKAAREAEARKAAEDAAAARKAAAAPDNAKAKAFAATLRALPLPKFATSKAFDSLPKRIEALAQWIEAQIQEGGLL